MAKQQHYTINGFLVFHLPRSFCTKLNAVYLRYTHRDWGKIICDQYIFVHFVFFQFIFLLFWFGLSIAVRFHGKNAEQTQFNCKAFVVSFFLNSFSRWICFICHLSVRLLRLFMFCVQFFACFLLLMLVLHVALKTCSAREVSADRSEAVFRMLLYFDRYLCWVRFVLCALSALFAIYVLVCIGFYTVKRRIKKKHWKTWLNFQMTPLQKSNGFQNRTGHQVYFWFFLLSIDFFLKQWIQYSFSASLLRSPGFFLRCYIITYKLCSFFWQMKYLFFTCFTLRYFPFQRRLNLVLFSVFLKRTRKRIVCRLLAWVMENVMTS